jgi:hypothetical protein
MARVSHQDSLSYKMPWYRIRRLVFSQCLFNMYFRFFSHCLSSSDFFLPRSHRNVRLCALLDMTFIFFSLRASASKAAWALVQFLMLVEAPHELAVVADIGDRDNHEMRILHGA